MYNFILKIEYLFIDLNFFRKFTKKIIFTNSTTYDSKKLNAIVLVGCGSLILQPKNYKNIDQKFKPSQMIRFILLQNRHGRTRISKWFMHYEESQKVKLQSQIHRMIVMRSSKETNFLEFLNFKIVYKRYAGLYFALCIDLSDNQLLHLELIHLMVETLDQYFGNVCQLDIVFNFNKVRISMLNLKDYYSQCCQDVRGLIVKPFALIMNMWLKIYQFFYLSDLFRQILNTNLLLSSSLSLNKMSRKYWTLQEDQALKNIVQPMVDINWSLVVHRMYNVLPGSTRNAKQCRERWLNNLNRKSSDSYPWVSCEDKIILQQFLKYHQKEKNKWIIISQKVNEKPQNSKISYQRTPNDIKNRFYSIIRKGIRRINNELGKPVNPQQVRLLKPITISKLFQVIEQVQANEFLQIIYNMASDFPELSCYSQQISKEKLQRILAYVMEINRNQQKKMNRQNKTQKIKKRKSSLSTSQGQKRQNLNQSGLIFHQNQPIEQISNSQKIKESESYEKDIVDLFIGFYQQSQSLEFEQVDFGL